MLWNPLSWPTLHMQNLDVRARGLTRCPKPLDQKTVLGISCCVIPEYGTTKGRYRISHVDVCVASMVSQADAGCSSRRACPAARGEATDLGVYAGYGSEAVGPYDLHQRHCRSLFACCFGFRGTRVSLLFLLECCEQRNQCCRQSYVLSLPTWR